MKALWVSQDQIPETFGISARSVSNAIRDGQQIRRRYLGKKPIFSVEDIEAWISDMPADKDGGLS